MIDVAATVAAITTALEAYNAQPEQHVCESCSSRVAGRPSPINCHDCGDVVPLEADSLEWNHRAKAWRVGVTQNPAGVGFTMVGDHYKCRACRAPKPIPTEE